ncbi:unnamed protein product [Cylindrotheca closterium]|uniref:Uncharacterized protein n=1 Tax=Cylindrotheca closterium TaxID=2856 RepID=A0AAD2FS27_9STRA|nr:unnamed protein product [Cylindrotheca closterium]
MAKARLQEGNAYYHGEHQCQAQYGSGTKKGQACCNKAYHQIGSGELRCGTHSNKSHRTDLPKNPNAAAIKEQLCKHRQKLCETVAAKNQAQQKKGHVRCDKLRRMKAPPHIDGYLKVFPNFLHDNRKDGFGCKSLSPMFLGPIVHRQPGLPPSKNLENFHQGSKVFKCELLPDGTIGPKFYQNQRASFEDETPHRHKQNIPKLFHGTRNKCHGWVWKRSNGKEVVLKYIACRQFYCHFYEHLASQQENYQKLCSLRDKGYNLLILGYDGKDTDATPNNNRVVAEKLEEAYLDPSSPFGHEMVLLTLLTVDDPAKYPWRIHKSEEFCVEDEETTKQAASS